MTSYPKNEIIEKHHEEYIEMKKVIEKNIGNIEEILDVRDCLIKNNITGYKYNYSLDKEVQNLSCQKA